MASRILKNSIIIGVILAFIPFSSVLSESSGESDLLTTESTSTTPTTKDFSQNEKSTTEKVRRGFIESVDKLHNTFTIKSEDKVLRVVITTPETLYLGEDNITIDDLDTIERDRKVYVSGYFIENGAGMVATKIMIANKSKLTRK